jgi:hypothetical protein
MEHEQATDGEDRMKSRANIALIVFMVIAAAFLVSEHRAHLVSWIPYWPYLLLLACPLMHLFMHGGHGHGSHGTGEKSNSSTAEKK